MYIRTIPTLFPSPLRPPPPFPLLFPSSPFLLPCLPPRKVNCWPTVNGDGSCEVNIEYTLNDEDLELENVAVTIPLPTGSGSPVVASVDGEYHHNPSASVLTWTIPVINKDNDEGSMEFS